MTSFAKLKFSNFQEVVSFGTTSNLFIDGIINFPSGESEKKPLRKYQDISSK